MDHSKLCLNRILRELNSQRHREKKGTGMDVFLGKEVREASTGPGSMWGPIKKCRDGDPRPPPQPSPRLKRARNGLVAKKSINRHILDCA